MLFLSFLYYPSDVLVLFSWLYHMLVFGFFFVFFSLVYAAGYASNVFQKGGCLPFVRDTFTAHL